MIIKFIFIVLIKIHLVGMRDEELNGGHVHTLVDRWMGHVMVRHPEPGIYIKQNLNHLSKRLIIMSSLFFKPDWVSLEIFGQKDLYLFSQYWFRSVAVKNALK